MTNFQMINNYRNKMEGLVSSEIKFQTIPNYRDEMHIYQIYFIFNAPIFLPTKRKSTSKLSHNLFLLFIYILSSTALNETFIQFQNTGNW